MSLRCIDQGELVALARLVNHTAADDCKLHLYTNNVTPAETDTTASYTEASGGGYAEKTLTGTDWVVTANPVTYAQQTFTWTSGGVSVYGYYVSNNAADTVLWAERFSSVLNVPADGGVIKVTPKIGAD